MDPELPKSLKMPKPLERYTKEELDLNFYRERIIEVSRLIQGSSCLHRCCRDSD